ncbi:MAG: hypothetical protein QXH91_09335 [Candidatus Bathyarchaeia archaeon]
MNSWKYSLFIGIYLFFSVISNSSAIVYLLRPGIQLTDIINGLRGQEVWKDSITYNGIPGTLTVFLCPDPFPVVTKTLEHYLVQFSGLNQEKGGIIIDFPHHSFFQRMLILQVGTASQPVIFLLNLQSSPNNSNLVPWPTNLPRLGKAKIQHLFRFQQSGSIYLIFYIQQDILTSIHRELHTNLVAQGWQPIQESDARGGVFLRGDGKEMILLNLIGERTENLQEMIWGAIYLRPLKR